MSADFPALDPTAPRHDSDLDGLVLGPAEAERRLVLLHGWGADADDLLDLGAELVDGSVQLVALRAPWPHPAGVGRQWYDLQTPGWPELAEAREGLDQRLQRLAATVPLEQTALLGFSQGAAMALDVASTAQLPLAALIACSGYPHPDWRPATLNPGPRRVLLTHGSDDPVVPYAASEEIERLLRQAGLSSDSQRLRRLRFQGGHGIDPGLFPVMRQVLKEGWADQPFG